MNDETTIFRGSPSIITRFGALFLGFLILVGTVVGAILVHQQPYRWALLAVAGLALIYCIAVIILVKAIQYEVTSQRIRVRTGLFTKRTDEVELYRANDTSLIEPLTLRLLGLGTIEIRTNDASTPVLYLNAIHGARALREELRKSIEECRDRKRVRMTEWDQPDQHGG